MIHCVYGKLGSGKGICLMDWQASELVTGFRDIVTTVPVRLGPWVNGAGEAQMGLTAFLNREHGETFDVENRLLVVPNDVDSKLLFLLRRDPAARRVTPKYLLDRLSSDGEPRWFEDAAARGWFMCEPHLHNGRPVAFNPNDTKGCAPLMVVNDEAWQAFPVRGGEESGIIDFYARQQRKLRDEWYLVTQHHDDLHCVFARIAQDHTVCRNHGKERMGVFRQPALFRTQTFLQMPRPGAKVFHETSKRLNFKGLAQCYDTSAGVGVQGGFAADIGDKGKGIPFVWLIISIVVGLLILASLPILLGKGSGWFLRKAMGQNVNTAAIRETVKTNRVTGLGASTNAGARVLRSWGPNANSTASVTPVSTVFLTGVVNVPGRESVFLSDGRVMSRAEGVALQFVHGGVVVGREFFTWPLKRRESGESSTWNNSEIRTVDTDANQRPRRIGSIPYSHK